MSKNSPIKNYAFQLIRAFVAAFTIILCSQFLGAEGRGIIGALLFYVSLITTTSEFVGGSSLANLIVKHPLNKLIPFSYLWALIVNVTGCVVLWFITGWENALLIFIMSFCMSLLSIHFSIYQGQSKTNYKAGLQLFYESLKLVMIAVYLVFIYNHHKNGVQHCILIFGISTLLVMLYSFVKLQIWSVVSLKNAITFPSELVSSGFWSQLGHLAQLFNYRVGILLLLHYYNDANAAGVYSNIVLIADTLWIFANSFGSIAHMRIIQSRNTRFIADITLRYTAISIVVTSVITCIILLIPQQVYTWIFGSDFSTIKTGLLFFTPGIIALSASASFSNYFHGTNRFRYLFAANLSGLIVQVIIAYFLIPLDHLWGICLASGGGFIAIFLMLFIQFKKQNPHAMFQWKSAITGLKRIIKKLIVNRE